jgi:1-acyl-sn-glycerol-3-phosphate acyltransferase
MTPQTMLLLAAGAIGLLALIALFFRTRAYIKKVSACGYIHPAPGFFARLFLRVLSRLVGFFQVGHIKVVGRENIPSSGPYLVTANHPSYADPAMLMIALKRPLRFLAAQRFFQFCFGLPSLLAAPCGAISVDLHRGKGAPAFKASVEVLNRGEVLAMFPEGYAYLDHKMGPFRKGAPKIVQAVARQTGKPAYIVPIAIRYWKAPGSWIRKWDEPKQYFWLMLNWWYYRRGATIVIGKPISSQELPKDGTKAADYLAQRIAELDAAQELIPVPSGVNLPYPD